MASGYHSTMLTPYVKPLFLTCSLSAHLMLSGCYYAQAVGGQFEVLRKREPIADVIADPQTPSELADRLLFVQGARAFSIAELGLPDNKSYQSSTQIKHLGFTC